MGGKKRGGLNCAAGTKALHPNLVCLSSGHCSSPLGPHTGNNTPVCMDATARLYVLSCPYKHTQELADGITAGK